MVKRPQKPEERRQPRGANPALEKARAKQRQLRSTQLLQAAFDGNLTRASEALARGASIDTTFEDTGLTALHIAVGTQNLRMVRMLVEHHAAPFGPDARGRWPSLLAATCKASDELCDYVLEAEAEYLKRTGEAIE